MIRRRRMQEAVENLSDLTYDYCLNFDDIVEDLCLNNEEQEALSEIAEDMLIDEIWVRAKGRRGHDGKRIQYSRPGGKVWMSLDDPKNPVFLAGKKGGWEAYQKWKKSQPSKQKSSDLVSDEVSPSITFDTGPFGLTPDDSVKKSPHKKSTTGGTKRVTSVNPNQSTLFDIE